MMKTFHIPVDRFYRTSKKSLPRLWDCTNYDKCLRYAAEGNLVFNCSNCKLYQSDNISLNGDLVGYVALLATVFGCDYLKDAARMILGGGRSKYFLEQYKKS